MIQSTNFIILCVTITILFIISFIVIFMSLFGFIEINKDPNSPISELTLTSVIITNGISIALCIIAFVIIVILADSYFNYNKFINIDSKLSNNSLYEFSKKNEYFDNEINNEEYPNYQIHDDNKDELIKIHLNNYNIDAEKLEKEHNIEKTNVKNKHLLEYNKNKNLLDINHKNEFINLDLVHTKKHEELKDKYQDHTDKKYIKELNKLNKQHEKEKLDKIEKHKDEYKQLKIDYKKQHAKEQEELIKKHKAEYEILKIKHNNNYINDKISNKKSKILN